VKWLYFPFKDISADPTMPKNLKRYQGKYGANLTVRQFGDGELFNDVGDDDMFIVVGHGLPGNENIGVSVKAEGLAGFFGKTVQVTITANTLADMLMIGGLPYSHKYIKTISCGGAGIAIADDANVRLDRTGQKVTGMPLKEVKSQSDCFACVLAKAMAQRKYWRLLVRGYPGFVNAKELQKTVFMESGDQSDKGKGFTVDYWGGKKVKMMQAPTKSLEEEYWFDGYGRLVWR